MRDPAVERALRTVPRHLFLPAVPLRRAYADEAVAVKASVSGELLSSASQPSMIAIMLAQLAVRPGHRVLEVGTGTGYNAALLACLAGPDGRVVTFEIDLELAARAGEHLWMAGVTGVRVVAGDGTALPAAGPYDRIMVTAAADRVADGWVAALAAGGRLVVPIGDSHSQLSTAYQRRDGDLVVLSQVPCRFVPLRRARR